MSLTRKPLGSHHQIVIKIGSALLVDRKSGLKKDWLDAICEDIAALKKTVRMFRWCLRALSLLAAPCSACLRAR